MDLGELQRRVDRYARIDLRPHYEAYRARGGADVDGFLAYLGATRAVEPSVLTALYAMTDVETPSIVDPVYRGTWLATWANAATLAGSPGAGPGVAAVAGERASDIRFQSISRLGEGAMGAVDIARDVFLRRTVALKTVLPEMAGHAQVFGRFLAEMQITAQLEHPNIVPVYALDVSADGSLGYAMKLVQGRELAMLIDEARAKADRGEPLDGDLAIERRLDVFLKVCDALAYAHQKGIVHRDLKPANIMIGRHNEVYLMDWGIARPIGAGREALEAGFSAVQEGDPAGKDAGRTRLGDVIGTPQYMSPEQAQGKNHELTGKSDQYAMGLILQECVTLRTAVDGSSLHEVLAKAMLGKRDPGAMPREIDAVVRKATRLDPNDRYPDVGALAEDVRRYLRGEPVSVLPEGPIRRAGRWLSRHRMATLTIVLGLALVGAAGTIGALIAGQARVDAQHARELRVSRMAAETAIQTQLVDRALTRYEAALEELVGAAQLVLSKEPGGDLAPVFAESFASREGAPPDLAPSKRYRRDISVLAPVTQAAPGVDRAPLQLVLRSIGLLVPAFNAVLLESSGVDWRGLSPLEQRALIADAGVPAYRASITLREGAAVSFPGMAGLPPGDPREAPSYKLVENKHGVAWGTRTEIDGEPILPASAPLYDESGAFRGVAVLQVSLDKLLAQPSAVEMDYVQSRALVGRDGKIMAEDRKGDRLPLPPDVAAAVAAGKSGTIVAEANGRRYRYAFYPLSSIDWSYVAVGEEGRVTESKDQARTDTSDPRKVIAPPEKRRPARPPAAAPAAPAASSEPQDAGAPSASASAPPRRPPPVKLPPAAGTDAPLPPNPFDKWKVYERKKKKP